MGGWNVIQLIWKEIEQKRIISDVLCFCESRLAFNLSYSEVELEKRKEFYKKMS